MSKAEAPYQMPFIDQFNVVGNKRECMAGNFRLVFLCILVISVISSGCTSQPVNLTRENTTVNQTISTALTRLEYHRIYLDAYGESHFDTVMVE